MNDSTKRCFAKSPYRESFTTERPLVCELANSTKRWAIASGRCRFCGFRAIPGDDVCFQCH